MQGQRSAVGSLPELSFHNDPAANDTGIDPQRCWNNMRNPAQDQLSDCVISASNASIGYLNSAGHEGHNLSGWSLGESSSSVARDQVNQNEHVSAYAGSAHVLGGRQHGSSDILSLNNAEVGNNQAANGHLFVQTSLSASIPRDYTSSGFSGRNDDDCQIIECTGAYTSGSSDERLPGTSTSSEPCGMPSGSGGYLLEGSDGRPSCSLDGRRSSCKRKTIEGSVGQSSGSGSSNHLQVGASSFWHTAAAHHNTASGILAPTGNNLSINLPEQLHPRLALSVGGAASEVPLTLSASASAESSRRNFRLRINTSHQQDSIPGNVTSTESLGGSSNLLSAQHSLRLQPSSNSLDSGAFSVADSGSVQRQSVAVHIPSLHQHPQTRWHRASSSGASSSNSAFCGERDAVPYEGPLLRSVPRNISEHPMFLPATEMGTSSQTPLNWSLAPGNISIAGNAASTSHVGLSSGVNLPAPSLVPNRNSPQYPRRLSEFVRRSLLSSTGSEPGSQNSSYTPIHSGPASSSREIALPSGSGHHGHRRYTRSAVLLERHLGSALGFPYSGRTSAAASEGRNRLVSEIRNVLDLVRRGEGLRFEDVMILDQSVFFGMADIDDRHRDMRLDVDNMSYEELLALEERIGNVCTGLSEETITSKLKQRKYVCITTEGQAEAEPCCVCQEEYNDGEDIGTLECGHDYHADCIKQWLLQKNLCPICKTTGLTK